MRCHYGYNKMRIYQEKKNSDYICISRNRHCNENVLILDVRLSMVNEIERSFLIMIFL